VLCSRCSRQIRPVVAFDIDGTLGDYHGHIHRFTAGYLAKNPNEALSIMQKLDAYDGEMPHGEWYEANGISRETFRQIKLAYRQGSMKRTMPPYIGAIEVVRKTAGRLAEVWLTTTRPYLRLDNVDPDTRWWVEKHGIPYNFMLYDEFKYQELAERVDRARVVAVVDDLWEMYDDAEDVYGHKVPILYQTQYNVAVDRENIAFGCATLWKEVLGRIEQYERNNG
jgi:hypothetical protein